MKNKTILSVIFGLILMAKGYSLSFDIYSLSGFSLDSEPNEFSYDSQVCGLKFTVPTTELRFFSDFLNMEKITYGGSFSSQRLNKTFPVVLKAGKLSFSGGNSLLSSPAISSSVSPFSGGNKTLYPILASLPSYSSFNKCNSIFLQASYSGAGGFLQTLQMNSYFTFEKDFASSIIFKSAKVKGMNFSAVYTVGSFLYDAKKSDSWFEAGGFFHEGRQVCQNAQILFGFRDFTTIFSANCYISPFQDVNFLYRSENRLKTRHTLFSLAIFLNPCDEILTSSQKKLDSSFAAKSNFQIFFTVKRQNNFPIFLKGGIGAYWKISPLQSTGLNTEQIFKIVPGFQVNSRLTNVTLTAENDFSIFSSKTNSFQKQVELSRIQSTLKNTWYFSKIQPGYKIQASFTPVTNGKNWDSSETCAIYLSFCENPSVSLQSSATFSQKNNVQTAMKFELSGTAKFSWKWLGVTAKLSMTII